MDDAEEVKCDGIVWIAFEQCLNQSHCIFKFPLLDQVEYGFLDVLYFVIGYLCHLSVERK